MRPSGVIRLVRLLADERIPHISISIQRAHSAATHPHILAAKHKRRRLVLVADRQGVVEPVLNIGAPLYIHICVSNRPVSVFSGILEKQAARVKSSAPHQKSAINLNIDVLQPGHAHHCVDIVRRIGREDNSAAGAALLKRGEDGRRIVSGVGAAGWHDAGLFAEHCGYQSEKNEVIRESSHREGMKRKREEEEKEKKSALAI